jgi:CheY-like chemotaxis protein
VDDNKINLELLHTFVKRRGYGTDIVHTAADGQAAHDMFKERSDLELAPDIIFMDISMPVMDGYEATRAIRDFEGGRVEIKRSVTDNGTTVVLKPKRALIVALTGNTGAHDEAEAMDSGCDMYMTKPMSMRHVAKVLDEWRE